MVVIASSSHGLSKWKKGPSVPCEQAFDPSLVRLVSPNLPSASVMDFDPPLEHFFLVSTTSNLHLAPNRSLEKELEIEGLFDGVANLGRVAPKNVNDPCFPTKPGLVFGTPLTSQGVEVDHAIDGSLLKDISNALNTLPESASIRTWKKLACEVKLPQESPLCPTNMKRRPLMELDEPQSLKKRCLRSREVIRKENY